MLVLGKLQCGQLVMGEPVLCPSVVLWGTPSRPWTRRSLMISCHSFIWVIFPVIQTCLLGNWYLQEVGPTRPSLLMLSVCLSWGDYH